METIDKQGNLINTNNFVSDPSQSRTLKNIRNSLKFNLKEKYNITDENIVDELLKIHGLHKDNFDFVGNSEKVIKIQLNDVSIDDNSNKNDKTIMGMLKEITAPVDKALGFDMLYQTMREIYGKKEAKRLSGEMYDFSLGISDSTKLLIPYCWALDASKIVMEGRQFGALYSGKPKRVDSYISALSETIHQMSNHLAGALAVGTYFMDIAHLMIFRENVSLFKLKQDKKTRKRIENEFQKFIHSVNHTSRLGTESPFTNLSIFDRAKLESLLSKENMGWYFDSETIFELYKNTKPTFSSKIDNICKKITFKKVNLRYAVEYIIELQNIFMNFFDKGDPSKNGLPYRFPVITVNISKKVNGDIKIADEKFLDDFVNNYDFYRYNIFSSEGTKIASCCRLINDVEMLELASSVNSFGGSSISLGSHRVLTINLNRIANEATDRDNYYTILEKRIEDTAKILKAHKELIKITTDKGMQMFIKMGWINMDRMFSTFGLLGYVEAVETLYKKFGIVNYDNLERILIFINDKVAEYSKKYGIIGNIEQIPAESMAHRLPKADKLIFGDKIKYNLYANQFIPLWDDVTLWDRMEKDGKYNKLFTGGGIVHAQIGENITSKQAKNIIIFSIKSGSEHFALNSVWTECIDGHVFMGKFDKCPKCNKEIKSYYTRVIGFFTPVSSWNYNRREYDFPNRTFVSLQDDYEDNT